MDSKGDRYKKARTDKGYYASRRVMSTTAASRSRKENTLAMDDGALTNNYCGSNDGPYNGKTRDDRRGFRNLGKLFIASYFLLVFSLGLVGANAEEDAVPLEYYGVDVSYPMHHSQVTSNFPWLPHNVDPSIPTPEEYNTSVIQPLGDRQSFYTENIAGCVDFYGTAGGRCLSNERDRIKMSLRQPKSMVNYTEHGFTKIRAPEEVMTMLRAFWDANKDAAKNENWKPGNIYTNHWKSPSKMVSVENSALEGGGALMKQKVWDASRDTIQQWTGQRLADVSLYGIRIYETGAILAPHVDRLPLVSSAIINIDQDVDEPWPLEVIGHDGKSHNITMVPGDLVLYESHSVIHGRPFPLQGRFMANIFVHFEPVGPMSTTPNAEVTADLPPYIIPGSEEEENWRNQNPNGWKSKGKTPKYTSGATEAHISAGRGHTRELNLLIDANKDLITATDRNGWTPLHEAIRSNCVDCVINLLQRGADANALTKDGRSPLHFAKHFSKQANHNNKISHWLERFGANEIGPEL